MRDSVKKRVVRVSLVPSVATVTARLDDFIVSMHAFEFFKDWKQIIGTRRYSMVLPKVYAAMLVARDLDEEDLQTKGQSAAMQVHRQWSSFLDFAVKNRAKYVRTYLNRVTREENLELRESRSAFGGKFQDHAEVFFGSHSH